MAPNRARRPNRAKVHPVAAHSRRGSSNANNRKPASGRTGEPTQVQWLRLGAATVGMGAALVMGQGVAAASTDSADNESSSSSAERSGTTPSSQDDQQSSENNSVADSLDSAPDDATDESASDVPDEAATEAADDEDAAETDKDDPAEEDATATGVADGTSRHATGDVTTTDSADEPTSELSISDNIEPADEPAPTDDVLMAVPQTTAETVGATLVAGPVTFQSMVVDVLHWIGLGPVANSVPLPAWPVPPFVESVWLAVREYNYRWNNQRPTARPTLSPQEPDGQVIGSLNAVDFEGDTLTYTVTRGPRSGTVQVDSDGNFVYKPSTSLLSSGGTDTFVVTIDDRTGNPEHEYGLLGLLGLLGPAQRTIRIRVAKIDNRAPVAGDPAFEFSADLETGVLRGVVNVTDPDGNRLAFQATNVDPDAGRVVIDQNTGRWTFTPTTSAQLRAWVTPGEQRATFTILANDGQVSTPVAVNIPILAAAELRGAFKTIEGVGNQPVALAVSGDGRTYVASHGDGKLFVVQPDGTVGEPITIGTSPFGVAVSKDGRVYLSDTAAGTITAIDPDARTAVTFATVANAGALTFDSEGRAYVASTVGGTITVLNADGVATGRTATIDGIATGLAVDSTGSIIATVLDGDTARLIAILPDGTPATLLQFGADETPYGVDVDADGRIYVTDLAGKLRIITGRGATATTTTIDIGTPLAGVAVGADGRIHTTDILRHTVTVLTPALPQRGLYGYDLDPTSGVATGQMHVVSPEPLTYTVTSGPSAGTVTIDATTGQWVFTPTAAQRFSSWIRPGTDHVSFSVLASSSTNATVVNVDVTISPAADLLQSELAQIGVEPSGIAVTSDGRYLVTSSAVDSSSGALTVVRADGTIERTIALDGPSVGVATGPDGRVYVTDYEAGKVLVVDLSGNSPAAAFATVAGASAVAVDKAGRVLVTSVDDGTLTIFNPDGTTASVINVGGASAGVAVAADGSIVVSVLNEELSGGSLLVFTPGSAAPRRITLIDVTPYGVVVGPDGRILVTDYDGAGVVVLEHDGSQSRIETAALPFGITVASDGSLYVTHLEAGSISALTPVLPSAGGALLAGAVAGDRAAMRVAAAAAGEASGNSANGWIDRALNGTRRAAVVAEIPYTDWMEGAHGIAVSPDGKYIYAGTAHSSGIRHGLAVIDASTNKVIRTVRISGDTPHGVAVSADGRYVYVRAGQQVGTQYYSGVSIVDTRNNFSVRFVPVSAESYVGSIAAVRGDRAYASLYNGDQGVAVINATTGTVITVLRGIGGGSIEVSPDGTRIYVPGHVINTSDNSVATTRTGWQMSADGKTAYSAGTFNGKASFLITDVATGEQTRIAVDNAPARGYRIDGIVLSPDGTRAYLRVYKSSTPSGGTSGVISLVAINLTTKKVIGEVPYHGYGGERLAVSPDGTRIYIASLRVVTVVNTAAITKASTSEIASGSTPRKAPDYNNVIAKFVEGLAGFMDEMSQYSSEDFIKANSGLNPLAVDFLRRGVPLVQGVYDVLTGAKSIGEGKNPITGPLKIISGLAGAAQPHIPIFPPHLALVKAVALGVGTVVPVFVAYLNEAYPDL